ncbi:hypothetical protein [Halovulum sp. GXIMD14793]
MRYIQLIVALAGTMLAGVAPALTPKMPPPCLWDQTAQKFADKGFAASIVSEDNGFASFIAGAIGGPQHRVLQHCPTGKYLLIVMSPSQVTRIEERFRFFMETTVKVTMEEIALDIVTMGAGVRRGQGDIGQCGCDYLQQSGQSQ